MNTFKELEPIVLTMEKALKGGWSNDSPDPEFWASASVSDRPAQLEVSGSSFKEWPSNHVEVEEVEYYTICVPIFNTSYSGGGPGDFILKCWSLDSLYERGIVAV